MLGLKDGAADLVFEQLFEKWRSPLDLVFVSISDWACTAHGGNTHDMGSYRAMMQLAQSSIVELNMVILS